MLHQGSVCTSVYLNKHSYTYSFKYCLWLFCAMGAEVSSCNKDWRTTKAVTPTIRFFTESKMIPWPNYHLLLNKQFHTFLERDPNLVENFLG
jgi:hypothetical protein